MKCNEIQKNLSAYLDQELPVEEMKVIHSHLADCTGCREELDALQKTVLMLSSLEELIPPASFRSELCRKLERDISKDTRQEKKGIPLGGLIKKWIRNVKRPVFIPVAIFLILLILILPSFFDLANSGIFNEGIAPGGYEGDDIVSDSMYSMRTKAKNNVGDYAEINRESIGFISNEGNEKQTNNNNKVLATTEAAQMYGASSAEPGIATGTDGEDPGNVEMPPESAASAMSPKVFREETMDKKIIKNAELILLVNNYDTVVNLIKEKAATMGGYTAVESSNTASSGELKSGKIEVRIPQRSFDDYLVDVQTLGKVKDRNICALDVTEEYVDVESRLKAIHTKEERLLTILTQQGELSDVLAVEKELANTRTQLESLQGRLRYLNNRTDFSTFKINLKQVMVSTQEVTTSGLVGVGIRAKEAFIHAINNVLLGLGKLIVCLSAAVPYLVVLAVLILPVRYGVKRRKKISAGNK